MVEKKERKRKTTLHECIVKRQGHLEEFDEKKLYASAYSACLNAHLSEKESEKIAEKVLDSVKKEVAKLKKRECISSSHLSILVCRELEKYSKDSAFLYETHLDLS